jgi:2,3-dihydroxyphenylpropionate 1,2-dioxygenase
MTDHKRLVVCASHSPGMERDTDHVFGSQFRAGLAETRELVRDFAPDFTVLFGGDHRRAFRHVVPTFAVAMSATILPEGGHEAGSLDVPTDIAKSLATHLLDSDFDISVCRDVGLDHAFAQPLRDLTGALGTYPVIPIPINCATAPLPSARRVLALGEAVGKFLDTLDARVLVIGTGGLSHSPPSLELDAYDISDEERRRVIKEGAAAARKKIKPLWDRAFLDALAGWDSTTLLSLTDNAHAQAGAGANEVRTWLAAGAAGGGRPLDAVVYEPVEEWITGMGLVVSH